MKRVLGILTAVLLICLIAVFATGCAYNPSDDNTLTSLSYVTFDINPSFEILADEEDKVVSCVAINDDADSVLNAIEVELVGKSITEVTAIIIDVSAQLGFLTEENPNIAIAVINGNGDLEEEEALHKDIENTIDKESRKEDRGYITHRRGSNIGHKLALEDIKADPMYADNKIVQNLGVGQYRIICEVMENCDITFEEAIEKSMSELMSLLKDVRKDQQEMTKQARKQANEQRKEQKRQEKKNRQHESISAYIEENTTDVDVINYLYTVEAIQQLKIARQNLQIVEDEKLNVLSEEEILSLAQSLGLSVEEFNTYFEDPAKIEYNEVIAVIGKIYLEQEGRGYEIEEEDYELLIETLREIIKDNKKRIENQIVIIDLTSVFALTENIVFSDGDTLPAQPSEITMEYIKDLSECLEEMEEDCIENILDKVEEINEENEKQLNSKDNGEQNNGQGERNKK